MMITKASCLDHQVPRRDDKYIRIKKIQKYITAMQGFSADELKNAQRQQDCWVDFYDLTKAYEKM